MNVTFTDGAGTINTRSRGADYGTENNLIIDGQFGANGVIYGSVTFADVTVLILFMAPLR